MAASARTVDAKTHTHSRAIADAIHRARSDLAGKAISICLLSGGSSNIRWIKPLIDRDLRSLLPDAELIELNENFQEIVAKGLAIECTRRFYTEGSGDFRAVTYNRLCLALRANDGQVEVKRYRPIGDDRRPNVSDDGVLLPSASILSGMIDVPLRWKVSLSKPPTHVLDYYFMKSSFEPEDVQNLHNIDHRILTPKMKFSWLILTGAPALLLSPGAKVRGHAT